MQDLFGKQKSKLERFIDTENYQDFKGLHFKVIDDLPPGHVELTTRRPTYIKGSAGGLSVTARAPTVIESNAGMLTLNGYAPVLVDAPASWMYAELIDNSVILGYISFIAVKAAPYLELIAKEVSCFNGECLQRSPVHLNAPKKNKGYIYFQDTVATLSYQYENPSKPYWQKNNLGQKIKNLLK